MVGTDGHEAILSMAFFPRAALGASATTHEIGQLIGEIPQRTASDNEFCFSLDRVDVAGCLALFLNDGMSNVSRVGVEVETKSGEDIREREGALMEWKWRHVHTDWSAGEVVQIQVGQWAENGHTSLEHKELRLAAWRLVKEVFLGEFVDDVQLYDCVSVYQTVVFVAQGGGVLLALWIVLLQPRKQGACRFVEWMVWRGKCLWRAPDTHESFDDEADLTTMPLEFPPEIKPSGNDGAVDGQKDPILTISEQGKEEKPNADIRGWIPRVREELQALQNEVEAECREKCALQQQLAAQEVENTRLSEEWMLTAEEEVERVRKEMEEQHLREKERMLVELTSTRAVLAEKESQMANNAEEFRQETRHMLECVEALELRLFSVEKEVTFERGKDESHSQLARLLAETQARSARLSLELSTAKAELETVSKRRSETQAVLDQCMRERKVALENASMYKEELASVLRSDQDIASPSQRSTSSPVRRSASLATPARGRGPHHSAALRRTQTPTSRLSPSQSSSPRPALYEIVPDGQSTLSGDVAGKGKSTDSPKEGTDEAANHDKT